MTAENKSKTCWSIVNNEPGKVKNKNHTPLIFRSDNTFFQIDSAAEAFNDYFLNIVEKIDIEEVDINSALLSLNKLSRFSWYDNIFIMEAEIICTFASLKNGNSSGYDGLSNGILKFCEKFLGKLFLSSYRAFWLLSVYCLHQPVHLQWIFLMNG